MFLHGVVEQGSTRASGLDQPHDVEHGGLVASWAADHLHADGKAGAVAIRGGGGAEHVRSATAAAAHSTSA